MTDSDSSPVTRPPEDDCPLDVPQQRRNMLLYGTLWGLYYLAAPVTYVGVTHANLLKSLGTTQAVANLPSSMYMWLQALPILVAWFFPQPKLAKPILVGCLTTMALVTGLTAWALWVQLPQAFLVSMIIAHGLIFGICSGLSYPAQWEILRRSVSSSRRGAVMAMAFGAGPVLACLGSLGQQFILTGTAHGLTTGSYAFPANYALLFMLAAPVMVVSAISSSLFLVPPAPPLATPIEFNTEIVQSAREFVSSRPIFLGVLCYVLVSAGGNSIMQTVSLAAPRKIAGESSLVVEKSETRTEQPEAKDAGSAGDEKSSAPDSGKDSAPPSKASNTVGYQNELRFGFKAIAGVLLGWLLARTNPKAALLATTTTLIVALLWALLVTGKPYLLAMGLLGAGELFGAYYPNYVASASPKHRVRINMAYLTMIGSLVGFAPVLFGWIADKASDQVSMMVAAAMLIVTMGIVLVGLPKDPRPPEPAAEPEGTCEKCGEPLPALGSACPVCGHPGSRPS